MTCTTHHHACECRERQFQELREYALRLEEALKIMLNVYEDTMDEDAATAYGATNANNKACTALASKPEIAL